MSDINWAEHHGGSRSKKLIELGNCWNETLNAVLFHAQTGSSSGKKTHMCKTSSYLPKIAKKIITFCYLKFAKAWRHHNFMHLLPWNSPGNFFANSKDVALSAPLCSFPGRFSNPSHLKVFPRLMESLHPIPPWKMNECALTKGTFVLKGHDFIWTNHQGFFGEIR